MNTTVTIKYADGVEREFVASDKLEESILRGEMFSVSTLHVTRAEQCVMTADPIEEEMLMSKMYVGNPVAALGFMIELQTNAKQMALESGNKNLNDIAEVVGRRCVAMLSDEIRSHQSGMTDPRSYDG